MKQILFYSSTLFLWEGYASCEDGPRYVVTTIDCWLNYATLYFLYKASATYSMASKPGENQQVISERRQAPVW